MVTKSMIKYYVEKYNLPEKPSVFSEGSNKQSFKKESEQRRRDSTLTIRLTDREKERIKNNASKMRVSVTDYLVRLSIETPIGTAENIKPMLIELKSIGDNIDLIKTKIFSGEESSYDFQDVIDGQKAIYDTLLEIVRNKK